MEQTKNQRFKIAREALMLDQTAIALGLGIKQGTVSGIENEKSGVSRKILLALSEVYGVRPEYINRGELPIINENLKKLTSVQLSPITNVKQVQFLETTANLFMIPIKAFGGFLAGYENKAYLDSLEKISFPWVRGQCFAFEVEGFSMVSDDNREESYYPGTWVVCTEVNDLTWLQKNKCYVFATIDGICIKQFINTDEKFCHLRSINTDKEYKVSPIPLKNIKRVFHIENKITKPS